MYIARRNQLEVFLCRVRSRTDIIYTVPIEGTDWFVNAHENINAISEEIKHLRFVYILGSLIFGFIICYCSLFNCPPNKHEL